MTLWPWRGAFRRRQIGYLETGGPRLTLTGRKQKTRLFCVDRKAADMEFQSSDPQRPWLEHGWPVHTQLLLDSFHHWLGRDLIPRNGSIDEQAHALFEAPRIVVSHGTQADPILNYGNRAALRLWEMDIQTLRKTPSRLTAEPMHRDRRAQLLERTARDGFVDDYQGIRISRSGRRFRIDRAIVWNLIDPQGNPAGQAATFSDWVELDRKGP